MSLVTVCVTTVYLEFFTLTIKHTSHRYDIFVRLSNSIFEYTMSRCFPPKNTESTAFKKRKKKLTNERKTDFPGSREKFFDSSFFFILNVLKEKPTIQYHSDIFFIFKYQKENLRASYQQSLV